jgi:hypothetical protein
MNSDDNSDRAETPNLPKANITPVKLLKRVAEEMDETVTKTPGQRE